MNRKRFDELLSRLLDETIRSDEGDELAAMVADDRPLRHELHSQFALDEALSQLADASRSARQFSESTDARLVAESGRFEFMHRILDAIKESSSTHSGNPPSTGTALSAAKYRKTRLAFVALACAAVAAVWLVALATSPGDRPSDAPAFSVGSFSRSANVQWAVGAHRWSVGDALGAGQSIEFDSGRVELQFDLGATMTVVGPAKLEVQSEKLVALHSGTATTRIENGNSGEFRVVTPATEVLDLGTEFGVRVRTGGETDVVVFDGEVDVTPIVPLSKRVRVSQRLSVGEAVCIGSIGGLREIVAIDSDAFPFGDEMFRLRRTRPPVIVGVSDDRRSQAGGKFYRINHEGLTEEARAYVDRLHEWNGVTPEGIPYFLRGADYIATFNDDKYEKYGPLEVTVELSRPAWLYVLYDDRMTVPDWLVQSFENTGYKIGVDAGPTSTSVLGELLEIGIGPGVSIDSVHSIWRRRVDPPVPVTLGPVGKRVTGRGMYGIAAQPL